MKTTHGKIPRRTRDLNLLGGAIWILPRVAKILATLLSTGAFATDEQGMARVLMHPPARMLETSSHELYFFCPTTPPEPPADRPATRKNTPSNRSRTHYDSNSTNRTKFTQTRRQTDISYKQRRKSYKIPDFHTNMTDFITFK